MHRFVENVLLHIMNLHVVLYCNNFISDPLNAELRILVNVLNAEEGKHLDEVEAMAHTSSPRDVDLRCFPS